jgi:hypothetical protein
VHDLKPSAARKFAIENAPLRRGSARCSWLPEDQWATACMQIRPMHVELAFWLDGDLAIEDVQLLIEQQF